MVIVNAWIQHPSSEFLADPVFDSLRPRARGRPTGEVPAAATVAAMDEAGVRTGKLRAWWGPRGPLISNDAVAATVRHKFLFGSNHPARPAADCLRDLASLRLDEETTEAFLHATAERVLGLAAGPGAASPATTERATA